MIATSQAWGSLMGDRQGKRWQIGLVQDSCKLKLAESIQCFCNSVMIQGSRKDGGLEALYITCIDSTVNYCDFKGKLLVHEKWKWRRGKL